MKARFEIAETFADQGDIDEARKYYSRLQLLDLDPADRERVAFRGPQLEHALKHWSEAESGLNKFIHDFPQSGYLPEAHYLRAKSLEALGRKPEAVQEVIALLRGDEPKEPERARQADYWKRRTGNELANQFYEQGDFLGALSIYQALARVNGDPSWSWPAVYQVGLCFERLKMPSRAAEAYRAIINPDPAPPAGTKLTETLVSLRDMAKWRLEHLDWVEDFGKRLQGLSAGKTADS
jgi:TolA-binding protein